MKDLGPAKQYLVSASLEFRSESDLKVIPNKV